jgi:undecaprenyl diphosphate synthase
VQAGELAVEDINETSLAEVMALSDLPAPDLCIRTGGDARISHFMLWQFAYSELYFTSTLWPDFGELEFARALSDYARRERRFGVREPDALASGVQDA